MVGITLRRVAERVHARSVWVPCTKNVVSGASEPERPIQPCLSHGSGKRRGCTTAPLRGRSSAGESLATLVKRDRERSIAQLTVYPRYCGPLHDVTRQGAAHRARHHLPRRPRDFLCTHCSRVEGS